MGKKISIYLAFIPLLFLMLFVSTPVLGESIDNFNVNVQLPENQIDPTLSYFDLLMEPEQEQTIHVVLTNRTDAEIKLTASFHRALTNSGGVVEYTGTVKDTSKTAPENIEQLVTLSEEAITLPASGQVDLALTIKMTDQSFDGVLAGGLRIEQIPKEEFEGNVQHVFSREVAVLLRTNNNKVIPKLALKKAEAQQNNKRNIVAVTMENSTATYINKATVEYQIMYKDKEFLSGKQENVSIAPNTSFPYHISMDGRAFEAGDYVAKMKVTAQDHTWNKDLAFTVKADKAKELNEEDITVENEETPWTTIILGAILFIMAILVIYLLVKNKRLSQK